MLVVFWDSCTEWYKWPLQKMHFKSLQHISFHFSPETGEQAFFCFFYLFFSFSDRLIFRREVAPSSEFCILIMCWCAQLIWKLNLAWGYLSNWHPEWLVIDAYMGGLGYIGLEWMSNTHTPILKEYCTYWTKFKISYRIKVYSNSLLSAKF
jgi:hypothetical protein